MKNPFKSSTSKDNDVKKAQKTSEVLVEHDSKKEKDERREAPDFFDIQPEDWDLPPMPNIPQPLEEKEPEVEIGKEKPKTDKKETKSDKDENKPYKFEKKQDKDKDKDKDKFGSAYTSYKPYKPYKPPIKDQKLSVVLIENTSEVAKENDRLVKIIKKLIPTGLVCIIHYGAEIKKSEILEIYKMTDKDFQCDNDAGDSACLYNALIILDKLVDEEYMVVKGNKFLETRINEIEIIGIGTCKDNCSKVDKSVGINCFCNVTKNPKIVTKYFCLTEDSFIEAAEIGFHSLGSINQSYQQ